MNFVGRSVVSAITHTPASGPFALATTPPMSSLSIATVATPLCCAWTPLSEVHEANEAATTHITANKPSLRLTRNFICSSAANVQRRSFPLRIVWNFSDCGEHTPNHFGSHAFRQAMHAIPSEKAADERRGRNLSDRYVVGSFENFHSLNAGSSRASADGFSPRSQHRSAVRNVQTP